MAAMQMNVSAYSVRDFELARHEHDLQVGLRLADDLDGPASATPQHSTAQHSTAQHSTAQHSTLAGFKCSHS
jgi:hypothetical protein